MIHAPDLDNPQKTYARHYRAASGRVIQIHTRRIDVGFGVAAWALTGSDCDDQGKALQHGAGHRIFAGANGEPLAHTVTVQADAAIDVAALLEAERIAFAARVERAAIVTDAANAIS